MLKWSCQGRPGIETDRSFAERKLRETIEAELKENLSERKALIRQEVHAPVDNAIPASSLQETKYT